VPPDILYYMMGIWASATGTTMLIFTIKDKL
jgi:hypothetical protein